MQKYKWVKVTLTENCRVPVEYTDEECSTHLIQALATEGGWPGVSVEVLPDAMELETVYQERKANMECR